MNDWFLYWAPTIAIVSTVTLILALSMVFWRERAAPGARDDADDQREVEQFARDALRRERDTARLERDGAIQRAAEWEMKGKRLMAERAAKWRVAKKKGKKTR